ncbi:hypothetical protein TNCV_3230531 [Trichonephila clavipes]|nr:hypothetical protein TNCV_3230531 [Trichonephila clavipes]
MLVRVYGDQELSMKCVYEWFARFRKGRERVSDNPCSGKSVTSVSDENIEKMMKLITKDRPLTVRVKLMNCRLTVNPSVTSRRKQQSAFDQVSEFDRGRIVAYRDCGLSFREISSRVG